MYRLKELNQSLVKIWNEVYKETVDLENVLSKILKEVSHITENELPKIQNYPFIKSALEEINTINITRNPYRELITSIYNSNDIIPWYPNTTFENPQIAIKNQNYCANLIGKTRDMQKNPYLFYSDDIIVGLFLMGRDQFYPEHYHPACETWVILSGNAKWKLEDGDWEVKRPGEHFTYSSNQVHAMKTEDDILLALWAWTGDLSSWAKWI